jgi:hypothetical protein
MDVGQVLHVVLDVSGDRRRHLVRIAFLPLKAGAPMVVPENVSSGDRRRKNATLNAVQNAPIGSQEKAVGACGYICNTRVRNFVPPDPCTPA